MSHIKSIHGKPIFYLILNVEKRKCLPKSGVILGYPISLLLFTLVFEISADTVGERKK